MIVIKREVGERQRRRATKLLEEENDYLYVIGVPWRYPVTKSLMCPLNDTLVTRPGESLGVEASI